jgi:hypothetical protein
VASVYSIVIIFLPFSPNMVPCYVPFTAVDKLVFRPLDKEYSMLSANYHQQRVIGFWSRVILIASAAMFVGSSYADPINLDKPTLGRVAFNGKVFDLTSGMGSALGRRQSDPIQVIYAMGDSGPTFGCDDIPKLTSGPLTAAEICQGQEKGEVYLQPEYSPIIFQLSLTKDRRSYSVSKTIVIRGRSGDPLTALTNPLTVTNTTDAFSIDGNLLPKDPSGIDAEGLAPLNDGSFWISEEWVPSLIHVAADGTVIKRLVPYAAKEDLLDADYPIVEALPNILLKRRKSRGFEAVGITPDQRWLFVALQNPLYNPDKATGKRSRMVRLLKIGLAGDPSSLNSDNVVAEFVFQLDLAATYSSGERGDVGARQDQVKLSELVALGENRVLLLERVDKVAKVFNLRLESATNILNTKWDLETTTPSLEALGSIDLAEHGVFSAEKQEIFSSLNSTRQLPSKLEGMAVHGDTLLLSNDNDFGVAGESTYLSFIKSLLD